MEGSMELELEGKIFIVEKDAQGNVINRDELDPQACLQAILKAIESSLTKPDPAITDTP